MTNWQKQIREMCQDFIHGACQVKQEDLILKISSLLEAQAKQEMIRRKKEKIMTAEATREFTRTQLLKEIEEKLCGKKSESIGNMSSEQTKERIRIILTTLNHSERRNAHSN